jgi:hypothetical protein
MEPPAGVVLAALGEYQLVLKVFTGIGQPPRIHAWNNDNYRHGPDLRLLVGFSEKIDHIFEIIVALEARTEGGALRSLSAHEANRASRAKSLETFTFSHSPIWQCGAFRYT